MKIISVTYDGFESLQKDDNYKKSYGNEFFKILNHATITYTISEISLFEILFLRIFSSGNVITKTVSQSVPIDSEKYKLLHEKYQNIVSLSETMESDNDIENKPECYFSPASSVQNEVIVTFTGLNICKVIDMVWFNFFKEVANLGMEDALIKNFISSFYKFIGEYLASKPSEAIEFIENEIYKKNKIEYSGVSVYQIHTSISSIHTGKFDKKYNLAEEIERSKWIFKQNDIILNDKLKLISVDYIVRCSFFAFLEMSGLLDIKFISDFQDIRTIYNNPHLIPSDLKKYQTRLRNRQMEYQDQYTILLSSNDPKKFIEKYSMVLLNSSITFSLRMNLWEISIYITEILENLDIKYGEKSTVLKSELKKILTDIKTIAKSTYKSLK